MCLASLSYEKETEKETESILYYGCIIELTFFFYPIFPRLSLFYLLFENTFKMKSSFW